MHIASGHTAIRDNYCRYCGSVNGITRDHVIPVSFASASRHYESKDIVSCCSECNSILSDKLLFTIQDRAAYLYRIYNRKYSSVLKIPKWTRQELEELDTSLRELVVTGIKEQKVMQARLANLLRNKRAKSQTI